ncbi:MAG: type I-U CRISPR-associated protein Csb2 [Desulfobulbus sp.]|nr:type I-U CRISPR-associated protein Csb2 [Desulfobulbus sp.]
MPTLSIRFTGGHYHATPWNKAQNEGAVEWPPSPWRILRALIATGYAKMAEWQNGLVPERAKMLIEKLASVVPSYRLPEATGTHSRHYMPIKGKTTLVLDARAVVGVNHEQLLVHWDIELAPEEENLLSELAARLGYLGRAESWTECALVEDVPITGDWVRPCENVPPEKIGHGWEQIPLMAPVSSPAYQTWRQAAFDKEFGDKKPKASELKKFNALYPTDLLACLQVETGWLQSKGWSQPPGAHLVLYWRPARNALGVAPPVLVQRQPRKPVPFALLALATNARSRSPMPLAKRTLPQAELLHRTIASFVGKTGSAQAAAELLGFDEQRKPLTGHRHGHAHILPLCLLKDDHHLDHILIWAPGGLSDISQDILRRIRETYMKGGVGTLAVRFAGAGTAEDFAAIPALRPMISASSVWQSLSPLVLPRHRKAKGKDTPDGQIVAELASRGLPAPEIIEWLRVESIAMRHHVRSRRNGASPPEDYGYALRLTFAEPITGPICLGYASHFGLGLFAPVPAGSPTQRNET